MLKFKQFVNEVLDSEYFKDFGVEESVSKYGVEYELKVYNAIRNSRVDGLSLGGKPTAGFSNVGVDIEAFYKGEPFNIEIKSSIKDQMGGGSFSYDMHTKKFTPVGEFDPDNLEILLKSANEKIVAINNYIKAARKKDPIEFHKDISGIPIKVSKSARDELKKEGYLKEINSNIFVDIDFIINHYNKKGVYYINIGGAGLFWMGENPLGLPVPQLEGKIQVEMRLGYGGAKLFFNADPQIPARSASLRLQARILTKIKSDYTLDDPRSIRELFDKLNLSIG